MTMNDPDDDAAQELGDQIMALLVRATRDVDFLARFMANPAQTLKQAGLPDAAIGTLRAGNQDRIYAMLCPKAYADAHRGQAEAARRSAQERAAPQSVPMPQPAPPAAPVTPGAGWPYGWGTVWWSGQPGR